MRVRKCLILLLLAVNRYLRFSRRTFLLPHFLFLVQFSLSFFLPCLHASSEGDVGNLVLPQGIQTVNFKLCDKLIGKAESQGTNNVHSDQ